MKLLYDYSLNNKILDSEAIYKIIDFLIKKKELGQYILDVDIKLNKSKIIASYSDFNKKIIIYKNTINILVNSINSEFKLNDIFEKNMYKNLSVLQVIMHEVEHAYQHKTMYTNNNIESFLIRLSNFIECDKSDILYELCPRERLAEINSYNELLLIYKILEKKDTELYEILRVERLQRLLRGYHYKRKILFPTASYFEIANRKDLNTTFEWYNQNENIAFENVRNLYSPMQRLKLGFPISLDEYVLSMKKIIMNEKKYFIRKKQY